MQRQFVDDKHMLFLSIAMKASVLSWVKCSTEVLQDQCVPACLSVLDTDQRGAPSPTAAMVLPLPKC